MGVAHIGTNVESARRRQGDRCQVVANARAHITQYLITQLLKVGRSRNYAEYNT